MSMSLNLVGIGVLIVNKASQVVPILLPAQSDFSGTCVLVVT